MSVALKRITENKLFPWFLWLAVFYSAWLTLVVWGNYWHHVTDHWAIALGMALGSYVAGSTPMGGGTVGFPILVLLFDFPATLGRNFSFLIQSVGMFSAALFILSNRLKIAWGMLRWAMLVSLFTLPLATVYVAPLVSDIVIKVVFAVVWCSFGIMTLVKLRELCALGGVNRHAARYDMVAGTIVGIVGGILASVTGVGIDMVIYTVLVLMWRTDLKIAVPTSVILMAFASQVGVAANLWLGNIQPEAFYNWLAAAPVVCLGAPLGSYVVNLVDRKPTLVFVALLCVGQFVWTCIEEKLGLPMLAASIGGVLLVQAAFHFMYHAGKRIERNVGKAPTPESAHDLPPITAKVWLGEPKSEAVETS